VRKSGITASGPYPADSLFSKAKNNYDVVLAMYHDQALIPAKTFGMDKVVNVTLGLPMIRTSVGHGVAYDIAGMGIADERSLIESIKFAIKMVKNKSNQGGRST